MAHAEASSGEWECLLAAERRFQSLVPGAVLVGGTAAALHAGHRISMDGDHVLPDLKDRFEEVLSLLEGTRGWKTERVQRPVLILGELEGCLTGIRQLIRTRPLEVERIAGLLVPSLVEMARIKGWLLTQRDTTRDYLDTVVLLEKLGEGHLKAAFASFEEIYRREATAASPLVELIERLGGARPTDRASFELKQYKGVRPPWNDWGHLEARGRHWASCLAKLALEP